MSKIEKLIDKGVKIPNPESVEIREDVKTERISGEGTVLFAGTKIFGSSTLILNDVKIGYESPVTIDNCYIGPGADLRGGYFRQSIFLKDTVFGSGSHVREGCIIEEEAGIGHTVGLKQTILFPYVMLGSLINFCDCFMAGGTDKTNHSEVGSSFIHFNFTPNQDKATPSLMGDVPQGVMLDKQPVFLGGQGGLVGPRRLNYGTITAAGTICRRDELREDRLISEGPAANANISYSTGVYRIVKKPFLNNIIFIGNLAALMQWYKMIRSMFVSQNFPQELLDGLMATLSLGINERIKRLRAFAEKMPLSLSITRKGYKGNDFASSVLVKQKKALVEKWPAVEMCIKELLNTPGNENLMESFIEIIQKRIESSGTDYISVIKSLSLQDKKTGTEVAAEYRGSYDD